MRQFSTTCLALFALLIITPGASAKDLDGRLGLGIEQSIAGVSGLTLRYWPSARLSLRSTLGGSVASGLGEDGDEIGSSIGVSFGVIYNIARSLHANLGLGASAAIGMRSETMRDATSSDPGARSGDDLQLSLEIRSSSSISSARRSR